MLQKQNYVPLFNFMRIFDLFALVVFITEIILKWLDNFWDYWKDSWNILDFTVTILVRFRSS